MKQVASSTEKNKYKVTKKEIDLVSDLATQYIKNWTNRELKNISKIERIPVIWPKADGGFLIGEYTINKVSKYCWAVYDPGGDKIHDFCRKTSAIFYCLCTQINLLTTAQRILNADRNLGKLESDLMHYEHSLNRAFKDKDSFRINLWGTRYDIAKTSVTAARQELEKTINSAKYNKIWE